MKNFRYYLEAAKVAKSLKVPTELKKLWNAFIKGHTQNPPREDFDLQTVVSRVLKDNGYSNGSRALGITDFVQRPDLYSIENFPNVWENQELIAQLKIYASKQPVTVTTVTNVKKLKDEQVAAFKTSFGFKKSSPFVPGVWLWPKEKKVRWFNGDYSTAKNNANFEAGNWFPVLEEEQKDNWGVYDEQVWKYQKPYKATGVRDAARRGLSPGRGVAGRSGGNLSWLKKLVENGKLKLSTTGQFQQINYKTNSVEDAVQTFYGSSRDLLELWGVPKEEWEETPKVPTEPKK